MAWCPACKQFDFDLARHHCPPTWRAWADHEEEDDARIFYATSAARAAEQWAEDHDTSTAEYSIAAGRHEPTVIVIGEDGEQRKFRITGEAVPKYYAEPVSESQP